ncbi:hypothetical protein [Lacticaseibacillus camelliae]|uniref:Uncharacterized protein n=1 Tax=Lacticaseibacillus camelliae DSM 22697 = JCM 13995 TaxID=1423730 RepID=A0A0R2FK53_9LACO|nr:hypothetical protein [Lacticaseibacillus camelliae]KRN24781.1 hypothetical protein FC75_GL001153 [Lacticaseibacillus camelliae DSM 22697 = JCM 13995]
MENKTSALQSVSHQLIKSTREFFALTEPAVVMPGKQVNQFAAQAFTRHYRVALNFKGEDEAVVGHLTRRLSGDRYLLQAYRSNVYRVVNLTQVSYLQRA